MNNGTSLFFYRLSFMKYFVVFAEITLLNALLRMTFDRIGENILSIFHI